MLAVVLFIYFLRILQKLSNTLHPSRQNWTTEVCFFCKMKINSWNYLSQLLLTSYFILVLSQWKKRSTPYIILPWGILSCAWLIWPTHSKSHTQIHCETLQNTWFSESFHIHIIQNVMKNWAFKSNSSGAHSLSKN